MTSPAAASPGSARAPRRSLSAAVLRLSVAALIAAVLVWSVLFVDLLRKGGEAAAALTPSTDQSSGPVDDRPAEAPEPVTTRSS